MALITSQPGNNAQQPSYIVAAATVTTTRTVINGNNETPTLCDIKILCTQKKKRSKRCIYLTFVESCALSSTDEQPCIEIISKKSSPPILLHECISFEDFNITKYDYQSFIYIYFQSYTVSICFSDEHMDKKPLIIKYLDYLYQRKSEKITETNNQQSPQDLPHLSNTEQILHTFDIKLIPYETIISRDHTLIGPARLYFTTTDLYIASIDCNQEDLKTTITNQCPAKDKTILCIPYFTINHYGNRSNIFLIELGKSSYGNGEIHMKCISSSLASTIHLLVSPVIEERPLILSSAFQNHLLTSKRMEKSKNIHPPVQLSHDARNQSIFDSTLPFTKKQSIESLPEKPNETKSRSVVDFFRKLVKTKTTTLQRSHTFNGNQDHLNQQADTLPPLLNKFFELNIEEKKISYDQPETILQRLQTQIDSSKLVSVEIPPTLISNQHATTTGTYIDMGPTVQKSDQTQQEEIKDEGTVKEPTATVGIGVNTIITLAPHIRSAIIVGTSVHLIAEDKAVFPIGQRSFTSPASVMQPFKAQLSAQTTINTFTTSTDMLTCAQNSSSSFHQPTSASNSQKSLLLEYGLITFNNNPVLSDQTDCISTALSDGSTIDLRLNSGLSHMSLPHQPQPSNIHSFDNILLSSSSSYIFRTLSLSTNNIGDNASNQICTSHSNIIFLDKNSPDQKTAYLLGPPPPIFPDDTLSTNLPRLSSFNLTTPISRSHLIHINEEKNPSNDSYALTEPLSIHDSPLPSVSLILTKSSLLSENSINYTDLLLPFNAGDQEQELDSFENNNELMDEKNERSSATLYTDIDFHQTQRRDRIAQFAAISRLEDQTPPFVL